MKKNHSLQGGAGCLLLASLLFLPTCALHKKTIQKEQIQSRTMACQTDSLHLIHQTKQKQQFVIHRDEIYFSAPDSNGQQHITALIRNRIDQKKQSTIQDTLSTCSSLQSIEETGIEKQLKQSPDSLFHLPCWTWVIILLSLLLFGRKKIKR